MPTYCAIYLDFLAFKCRFVTVRIWLITLHHRHRQSQVMSTQDRCLLVSAGLRVKICAWWEWKGKLKLEIEWEFQVENIWVLGNFSWDLVTIGIMESLKSMPLGHFEFYLSLSFHFFTDSPSLKFLFSSIKLLHNVFYWSWLKIISSFEF